MRLLGAALLLCLGMAGAIADEYPNCRGFIDRGCCCTNNCCFEVPATEARPIDEDGAEWLMTSTGERVKRTAWSQDGKFYRCACEMRGGRYEISLKDRTRCFYPAKRSAGF